MKKKRNKKQKKSILTALVAAIAAVLFSAAVVICLSPTEKNPFGEQVLTEESSSDKKTTTDNEVSSSEKTEVKTTQEATSKEATTVVPATKEGTTKVTTTKAPSKKPENTKSTTKKAEKDEETDSDRIIVNPKQKLWNLVVVNMSREMPSGYKPALAEVLSTGIYMDKRVAPHYEEMYKAAKKDGVTLTPYSGYRSYERQERNYKNLTEKYMSQYGLSRKKAAKKAASVILPPGTSEHNLGLAMDICNTNNSFANTKEYKWLVKNAHKYGFILRYTKDKINITGIVDEPWHWRYVGVEYAEDIKNSGLCLEEYLQMKGIKF